MFTEQQTYGTSQTETPEKEITEKFRTAWKIFNGDQQHAQ